MNNYIVKFAPFGISILDEDQRIVEGFLGDDKIDLDGHMIDRAGYEKAIEDYVKWGNVREMHNNPIGLLVSRGEKSWNHIVVKIVDDRAWSLIKAGVYKGFSIGARVLASSWVNVSQISQDYFVGLPDIIRQAIMDLGKVLKIDSILLNEISVVDRPANPRALILAYKSADNLIECIELPTEIKAAQELYYKGVSMKDTVAASEVQETVAAEVEKTVIASEEIAQVDVPVVEEIVAEDNLLVAQENGIEKNVENMPSEIDYAKEIEKLNSAIGALEKTVQAIQQEISSTVSSFMEQISQFASSANNKSVDKVVGKVYPNSEDLAIAESVSLSKAPANTESDKSQKTESARHDEPSVSGASTNLDIEAVIAKAVNAAIEKYVKTETNHERQNMVNSGDVQKVAQKSVQKNADAKQNDFSTAGTREKYNILARAIASSLN